MQRKEFKELLPIPEHLKKLAIQHSEPIRRKLLSFENAIWIAYLRGEEEGKEEMKKFLLSLIDKVRNDLLYAYCDKNNPNVIAYQDGLDNFIRLLSKRLRGKG